MKIKRSILLVVMLCSLVMTAGSAFATTISLTPTPQTVMLGNIFTMALEVSGLGDYASPSLGGFDITLLYDNSIMTIVNPDTDVVFGPYLGFVDGDSSGETDTWVFDFSIASNGELEQAEISAPMPPT